jgi:hypothetical protein
MQLHHADLRRLALSAMPAETVEGSQSSVAATNSASMSPSVALLSSPSRGESLEFARAGSEKSLPALGLLSDRFLWYPEGKERSVSGMVDHCTLEALRMRWLKREMWKASVAIIGMFLLLVLMVWVPGSAAGADERVSGLATPATGTVQATPTEDATVTALNKEKLAQEIQQLKNQNAPDLFGWLRTNAAVLLSTLVVVIGGLIGFFRWLGERRDEQEKRRQDQRSEQEKRAEERFQAAVTGLGDEKEGAKIGAAILLRTFLRPGYEQFYIQTFDLAVAHLRLPRGSYPLDGDPEKPLPLTTLSQALIVVFKEAFPLARKLLYQSAF